MQMMDEDLQDLLRTLFDPGELEAYVAKMLRECVEPANVDPMAELHPADPPGC